MQKTRLNHKKNAQFQRVKSKLILLFYALGFILLFLYGFRYKIYNSLLDKSSIQIQATIINDRNVLRKGIDPDFTYSYEFSVKGNSYIGDSKNTEYRVGNSIKVEYWPYWPQVSRPKKTNNQFYEKITSFNVITFYQVLRANI